MDFSYSEEQRALRELAARVLGARFTDGFRKAFARSAAPYDKTLWAQLAEVGLLGTAIAGEHGGSGLALTELGLLLEEEGRTLAAVPLFATLVLGALPLQRFGTAGQQALLGQVAAGEIILTAALEEPGGGDPECPATIAAATAEGWRLSGLKCCVPYGAQANRVLVAAQTDAGARLFLLDPKTAGVHVEPQGSTSGEPQAQLTFADVRLNDAHALMDGPEGSALRWTLEHAQVALAAQQLGVVSEALRRAVAYVSERRQFGRPIGSFQAVQHRLADAYIDVEALRSTYLRAAWALDSGASAAAEVSAAKWWAARAGHRVTHTAQHLHGGLGADIEYPVHAFLLRARQLGLALGGGGRMLAAIGARLAVGGVHRFT